MTKPDTADAVRQTAFVAGHYAPRAETYVTSLVHAAGEDLDQVEAFVQAHSGARVLDLGCGGGHVAYRAALHAAEVIAVDPTPAMLEAVARTAVERGLANIAVRAGTAEALPFPDARFDLVLSRFSAHHWRDLAQGLREARRVLAPGGAALFIDVVAPADRTLDTHLQAVELLRDPSHVRNYSAAEWTAALHASGFSPTRLTPRRLRMDFPVWIARTGAGDLQARAIRALQDGASPVVRRHFAIGEDGGFDLDTLAIEA